MNLFLTIFAGFIVSAVAAFSTTSRIITNLASNNLKNNTTNGRDVINHVSTDDVLGESTAEDSVTFNVDAIFNKALIIKDKITADNIVYGVKAGTGIKVEGGQNPVITNTGVTSLGGSTGSLSLSGGSGITIDGLKITNSGITSLSAGTGISVSGSTITNSDLGSSQYIFKTISVSGQTDVASDSNTDTLTLVGSGLAITTDATNDKITLTVDTPDYTLSGWTDDGTTVRLTTSTDSLGIGTTSPSTKLHVVGATTLAGAVTLGSATSDAITFTGRLANGTSILPNTDLGSDLGSSALRFNNLWVANINSNSSQSFSGQTTFSYAPTDTTLAQGSVIINPTTAAANGQLLGLAIAGYQRALIDEDGDIILGYSNLTSAPATDYPLTIYGHSGTNVSYIDTSGNFYMGTALSSSGALTITPLAGSNLNIALSTTGDFAVNTNQLYVDTSTDKVGIGTTNPGYKLDVTGTGHISSTLNLGSTLYFDNGGYPTYNYISTTGQLTTYAAGYNKASTYGHRFVVDGTEYFRVAANDWPADQTIPRIILNADTDTFWTHPAADTFAWYTAGSERLRIDSTGNIGIGTTAPTSKLHVSGAVTGKALSIFDETGDQNILTASASGTTRMVLTNAGNLGIGTTSPGTKLDIRGNDLYTGGITVGNNSAPDYAGYIFANNTYPTNGGLVIKGKGNSGSGLSLISDTGMGLVLIPGRNTIPTVSTFASGSVHMLAADASTPILKWYGSTGTQLGTIDASGNVGIGTTAPATALHVTGIIRQDNGYGLAAYGMNAGYFSNTANLSFASGPTTGSIIFSAGPSQRMRIDGATGNVGIGTTSPTSLLHVSGAVTGKALTILDETGDQNILTASASGTTRMVLTNAGNLGIGTTSPGSYTLNVNGTQYIATSLTIGGDGLINGGISTYNGEISMGGGASSNYAYLKKTVASSTNPVFTFRQNQTAGLGLASTDNLSLITNSLERIRIDSSGLVGIGTTSPTSLLHVSGAVTGKALAIFDETGDQNILVASASGTTRMVLTNAGNLGIGTTSPGTTLDVTGSFRTTGASGTMQASQWITAASYRVSSVTSLSNSSTELQVGNDSFWQSQSLYANGARFLTGIADGNVGIGTTAPTSKLHVSGAVTGKALSIFDETGDQNILVASASGTTKFIVDRTGKVGIGIAPTYALDVKGSGTGVIARFNSDNATGCTLATDGTISCSSDITLKKNVDTLNYGLSDVLRLNPVDFNWNFDSEGKTKSLGFIAQDVETIIPGLITTDSSGLKSLNTIGLVPVLTKAIQEQQIQINNLTNSSTGLINQTPTNLNIQTLVANGAVTFKSTTEFQGPAVFKALAEFFDKVIFKNDVFFAGKTKFNKDTAGVAVVSTYTNEVYVKFETPYEIPPVINITLNFPDKKDQTFLEEGMKAAVTDVSTDGFTIVLPSLAVRDFSYNWTAIAVDQMTTTKSASVIQDILGSQSEATPSPTIEPTVTITPFASPTSPSQGGPEPTAEAGVATDTPVLTITPMP